MSLGQRLMFLVKYEGRQISLANKINTTSQTISQAIKTDGRLRSDTLEAIAKAYPELNMRWFLTGEGESGLEMDVPGQLRVVREEDPEKEELKEELLGMYKGKVEMLEREIRMLKKIVKEDAPELAKKLEI